MTTLDWPLGGARAPASVRAGWTPLQVAATHFGLIAFAWTAYLCWLSTGAVVPWDSKNHFYPMFRFLADSLARGEAPTWNPYHFGGFPSAADPQSLLFTPTMFAFAWAFPKASMQAFDAAVLAHLVGGGFGVLALFRMRRWAPEGALLAAMAFVLGGSASARLQHTGMVFSYAFLPIAFALLETALERRSKLWAAAFGVAAALMTLGRDQVAFLGGLTLISYVAWRAVAAPSVWGYLRPRIGVLAVAALVGAAILAVPTLLTLQLLAASNRPAIAFGVAVTGSLAPVNLATLLAPNVFGSLNWDYSYFGPGYETSPEPDWTDRNVNYLYLGLVPAVLFVWHGLAGRRLFDNGARFFALLALLALIYAIGRATPLFAWAFDLMPGVSLYRRPADATFLLNFALSICAGYLLHRYIRDGAPRVEWRRPLPALAAGATLLGVLAVLILALDFAADQKKLGQALTSLLPQLALAGAALAALALAPDARRGRAVALALVALTGADLVWRNAASSLNAEAATRYSVYDRMTATESAALSALRTDMAQRAAEGGRPRVEVLGLSGPWMNASMALRLEDTIGYNPLRIAEYQRAVGPGENAGDVSLRHFPETFRGYRCRLASLLGVEYLVIDRPIADWPHHIPRPKSATEIFAGEHMYVYRFNKAQPRAFLAGRVIPADLATVLDEKALPEFDKTREALVEGDQRGQLWSRLSSEPAADAGPAGEVRIVGYANDRVSIEVNAERAGLLVLHDLYYPGWTAEVDGAATPVVRANLLFRGVEVGAGRHRVEFIFRPFSLANLAAAASSLRGHVEEGE
ncbi:MAG: YfhO family protein [Rhizobiales bacterium]|nr:YfhO family protein [Hyphomicrobiales bacterium]